MLITIILVFSGLIYLGEKDRAEKEIAMKNGYVQKVEVIGGTNYHLWVKDSK